MGWETLAIAGFQGMQAVNTMKQGDRAANAAVAQGQIALQNSANNTIRTTGKLQSSFLQSGLTLEGGPMDVITRAFASGNTDLSRIASNTNATAKNDINSARSKAIEGLVQGVGGASMGSSLMSGAGDFASGFGDGFSNAFNNGATLQTGATPGFGSYGPNLPQSGPLPWSA